MTNPKTNPTKSQVVGALSSAGSERLPYTQEVRGSNPLAPTEVIRFHGDFGRGVPRSTGVWTEQSASPPSPSSPLLPLSRAHAE